MGVSTDAILAFGFDLGEELPEKLPQCDDDGFDFSNWVQKQYGPPEPSHQNYDQDWPEYWAKCREIEANLPFDLITHCSYDYPMYFLAARGTQLVARRGYPEKVEMKEATPEQVQAMRDFCAEFGIEWQEPSWHIFSLWG